MKKKPGGGCTDFSVKEVPGEKGGLIGDIMEPVGGGGMEILVIENRA